MKIYIIGPSGSGKTTLANHLSYKYNVPAYELDCLVYDDEHDHVKRSDLDVQKLFEGILNKPEWIIEDVGREKFYKGLEKCDIIYYLRISKWMVYGRVVKRWFRQRLGFEKWNYPPTIPQFFDTLRVAKGYYNKEPEKINYIEQFSDKVVYLDYKEINKIIREI